MIKLKPRTNQEAFDMAYKGVMKQDKCSVNLCGACVYYGGPGVACAVGHLVAEEDRKRLNEFGYKGVLGLHKSGAIDVGDLSLDLLHKMQHAHDICDEVNQSEFKSAYHKVMTKLSLHWDLRMPALENTND